MANEIQDKSSLTGGFWYDCGYEDENPLGLANTSPTGSGNLTAVWREPQSTASSDLIILDTDGDAQPDALAIGDPRRGLDSFEILLKGGEAGDFFKQNQAWVEQIQSSPRYRFSPFTKVEWNTLKMPKLLAGSPMKDPTYGDYLLAFGRGTVQGAVVGVPTGAALGGMAEAGGTAAVAGSAIGAGLLALAGVHLLDATWRYFAAEWMGLEAYRISPEEYLETIGGIAGGFAGGNLGARRWRVVGEYQAQPKGALALGLSFSVEPKLIKGRTAVAEASTVKAPPSLRAVGGRGFGPRVSDPISISGGALGIPRGELSSLGEVRGLAHFAKGSDLATVARANGESSAPARAQVISLHQYLQGNAALQAELLPDPFPVAEPIPKTAPGGPSPFRLVKPLSTEGPVMGGLQGTEFQPQSLPLLMIPSREDDPFQYFQETQQRHRHLIHLEELRRLEELYELPRGSWVEAYLQRNRLSETDLKQALRADEFRASGGKNGEGSGETQTAQDPILRDLEKQVRHLLGEKSHAQQLEEAWAVIADKMQELGLPQAEWIQLVRERERRIAQRGRPEEIQSLDESIQRIKDIIEADIEGRFGLKVNYDLDLQEGFKIVLAKRLNRSESITSLDDFFVGFFESEYSALLTALEITGFNFEARTPSGLYQTPGLQGIRRLNLFSNSMGIGGALAIANSPHLANLTSLDLRQNEIGPEGVRAIVRFPYPYFTKLTSLDLSDNGIGDEGAREIADSPFLANLTSLYLWQSGMSAEGAQALAESPYLAKLISLGLSLEEIGPEGAQAIRESPHLNKLTDLHLGIIE